MKPTSRVLAAGVLGVLAAACGPTETEPEPYGPSTCSAQASWLTAAPPKEVAQPQDMCEFEQFAWQWLLALVQPTDNADILAFETWMPEYGIFVAAGDTPTRWGGHPPDPCSGQAAAEGRAIGELPFVYSNLIKQAGTEQPLIDPFGRFAWYGIRVNEPAYDMLTKCELYRSNCAGALVPGNSGPGVVDIIENYPHLAFPDGAVELKTAWKVLSEAEQKRGLFYQVDGWTDPDVEALDACTPVKLGLVGVHVVVKTPDFPAFVWASFEHRNNAPDCTNLNALPPLGGSWNFFDTASWNKCTASKNRAECRTNQYDASQPTQVCRMHPQGDSSRGVLPNGDSCEPGSLEYPCHEPALTKLQESSLAIQSLNRSVRQLIIMNPSEIDPVWANYELVGNVWTRDQTLPPFLQAQRGSLSAANSAMETYVQNGASGQDYTANCFGCHDQSPRQAMAQAGIYLPEAGLSHIFDKVVRGSGGCQSLGPEPPMLPAACNAYNSK